MQTSAVDFTAEVIYRSSYNSVVPTEEVDLSEAKTDLDSSFESHFPPTGAAISNTKSVGNYGSLDTVTAHPNASVSTLNLAPDDASLRTESDTENALVMPKASAANTKLGGTSRDGVPRG